MGWYVLDSFGSGYGPVEGYCEHGSEPLGSIKYFKFLEYLSDWFLLKKDSALWNYVNTLDNTNS
jgi:hypothetical protein